MDAQHSAQAKGGSGEPFTPRQLRILKTAVLVMSIILVVGFAAVIGRIGYLVTRGSATQPAPTRALVEAAWLPLPAGAAVRSVALAGDRLAVHYDAPTGAGIAILDLATGERLTQVDLTPR